MIIILICLKYGWFKVADIASAIPAVIISMLFIAGVFLFKSSDNRNNRSIIRKKRFPYIGKPLFEAHIKEKREYYKRNTDSVTFSLTYKGRLRKAFIASVITPPSSFYEVTPNEDKERHDVRSFCDQTIENPDDFKTIHNIDNNIGKLSGNNIYIKEIEWQWKIPEFAPLNEYQAIIGIWDLQSNGTYIPIKTSNDIFVVIDPNSSHFSQRINIG